MRKANVQLVVIAFLCNQPGLFPLDIVMEKAIFRLGSILGFLPFRFRNGVLAFNWCSIQSFHHILVTIFWHVIVSYQFNIWLMEFKAEYVLGAFNQNIN